MSDVSGQQTLPGNFAEEIMNFDLCQKLITSLGFSINWKKTLIPKTTADNVISRVQNQLNQHDSINFFREAKQLDSDCFPIHRQTEKSVSSEWAIMTSGTSDSCTSTLQKHIIKKGLGLATTTRVEPLLTDTPEKQTPMI